MNSYTQHRIDPITRTLARGIWASTTKEHLDRVLSDKRPIQCPDFLAHIFRNAPPHPC